MPDAIRAAEGRCAERERASFKARPILIISEPGRSHVSPKTVLADIAAECEALRVRWEDNILPPVGAMRGELIQAAVVLVTMIADIDRENSRANTPPP